MSYTADETYDVYHERVVQARVAHTCAACREQIFAGQMYTKVSMVFDGRASSVKRCARCQKIHLHLREMGADCDAWPDERLGCGQKYEDEWGQPPPDSVAAAAFLLPGEAMGDGENVTDEEFLRYVELHSRTPRALFSDEHLARVYALAGRALPPVFKGPVAGFVRLPWDVAMPLVWAARQRLGKAVQND